MLQIIQGQNVALAYIKENFALGKSEDEQFFTERFDNLPAITELEKQYLEMVISPLLYQSWFKSSNLKMLVLPI